MTVALEHANKLTARAVRVFSTDENNAAVMVMLPWMWFERAENMPKHLENEE